MDELKADNKYLWPHIEADISEVFDEDLLPISASFAVDKELLMDYLRVPGRGIGGSLVLRASQVYKPSEYSESATRLAAATEIMNAAILIVDDVVDGSPFRKSQPTIHESYESNGQSRLMARNQAMQLGVATMYMATRIAQSGMNESELAAQQNFQKGSMLVTAGQMLEAKLSHDTKIQDKEHVQAVHAHKTGHYSFEAPLRTGLLLAGASRKVIELSADIAQLLGSTFQLQDDVNGVLGDPEVTGKPNTDDAQLGLYTMLFHEAKQRIPAVEFAPVAARYGQPDMNAADHEAYRELVDKYGIDTLLNRRAQDCLTTAEAKLENLSRRPVSEEFVAYLGSIIDFLRTKNPV